MTSEAPPQSFRMISIIGDSQTFYLSDHPAVYEYCSHLNNYGEELFPSKTVGFYHNSNYDINFAWKFGQSAYSLDEDVLNELTKNSKEDNTFIVSFGVVDIRQGIAKYGNPEEVAKRYFKTVNNFFVSKGMKYFVSAPISNEGSDAHFKIFNETLSKLLKDRFIQYPSEVLTRKFQSSDKLNHINFKDAKTVVGFLSNTIRSYKKENNYEHIY